MELKPNVEAYRQKRLQLKQEISKHLVLLTIFFIRFEKFSLLGVKVDKNGALKLTLR